MRGLYEEVAKEIGERLKASPHRFVFLNMIWGFTHFHPFLIGIIRLPWNRIETERLIQESPGKDHSEGTTHFFKLSMADPETAKLVAAKERWYLPGLSAFISSIKYWEDHGVGDSE